MTREEAAKRWEWVIENFNDFSVYLWPDQRQELLASIALLRGTQPNPDTGLNGCPFCEALDDYKAIKVIPEFAYEYTAAIVSRLYKVGNPHSRATSTNYGHGKFALNYCPVCGIKLDV